MSLLLPKLCGAAKLRRAKTFVTTICFRQTRLRPSLSFSCDSSLSTPSHIYFTTRGSPVYNSEIVSSLLKTFILHTHFISFSVPNGHKFSLKKTGPLHPFYCITLTVVVNNLSFLQFSSIIPRWSSTNDQAYFLLI